MSAICHCAALVLTVVGLSIPSIAPHCITLAACLLAHPFFTDEQRRPHGQGQAAPPAVNLQPLDTTAVAQQQPPPPPPQAPQALQEQANLLVGTDQLPEVGGWLPDDNAPNNIQFDPLERALDVL